eukprot:TRINITY_DN7089_c0_g2_i7.p9 TRINITY_DN7089_c0_g2~~TRINITY_DN7089_c0_g2_i7.p9  ORF type:complete len:124 (+),score=6.60 TRINITY_DN7089_c0_g2_i7:439-810(+)
MVYGGWSTGWMKYLHQLASSLAEQMSMRRVQTLLYIVQGLAVCLLLLDHSVLGIVDADQEILVCSWIRRVTLCSPPSSLQNKGLPQLQHDWKLQIWKKVSLYSYEVYGLRANICIGGKRKQLM